MSGNSEAMSNFYFSLETTEGGGIWHRHAKRQSGVRQAPEGAQGHRPVPRQRGEMPRGRGQVPRRGAQDLRRADDRPPEGLQRAAGAEQQESLRPPLSLRLHAGPN